MFRVAIDGSFADVLGSRINASLEVGRVYRFRISEVSNNPGESLYPTVELIDRLHPPSGLEQRYPIRIVIPKEDIEMALQGRFVTRVVYLENPRDPRSLPIGRGDQKYFDALPGENPIQVADEIGRPMAIVRIGSRTPDYGGADDAFPIWITTGFPLSVDRA